VSNLFINDGALNALLGGREVQEEVERKTAEVTAHAKLRVQAIFAGTQINPQDHVGYAIEGLEGIVGIQDYQGNKFIRGSKTAEQRAAEKAVSEAGHGTPGDWLIGSLAEVFPD